MINEIKLFLFVLSIVYELKFVAEFIFRLTIENPTPLEVKEIEKIFLYFSIAYTITYILI
jgi:hypothetical protein